MTELRQLFLALSIVSIVILSGLISWVLYISYDHSFVRLPNSFYLQKHIGGKILLHDSSGRVLIDQQISQFVISETILYGWIDTLDPKFFFLDTESKDFFTFQSWNDLNRFTDSKRLPQLSMNNSFTFWDITSGHKKPTWSN